MRFHLYHHSLSFALPFQRLNDPKELIGSIFVDIVADVCPDFKKVFGVAWAPKVSMLKMPKCGGHVARMAEFFEQITLMVCSSQEGAGVASGPSGMNLSRKPSTSCFHCHCKPQ